jgi:hypothetical protein
LGREAQQTSVKAYLNGGKWKLAAEFEEVESGKRSDRATTALPHSFFRNVAAALEAGAN